MVSAMSKIRWHSSWDMTAPFLATYPRILFTASRGLLFVGMELEWDKVGLAVAREIRFSCVECEPFAFTLGDEPFASRVA